MNISTWPIGKILQLPDYCLSRRFVVSVSIATLGDDTQWDISELALPDRTIVHEIMIYGSGALSKFAVMRLALGDQLPTTTAEMDRLDPMLHGFGVQGAEPRGFTVGSPGVFTLSRLKMYLPAQGRRLVMELVAAAANIMFVCAALTVSSVPTEVPDWFCSA